VENIQFIPIQNKSVIVHVCFVFRRPLLLSTPRVIEYSDEVVFLFHPPHLSYHLHAPLPDNSIMSVIVVSVWIVLLRWGWVFLERARILGEIQFTAHFIGFFVVETKRFVSSFVDVILTRQACGRRSDGTAEGERQALGDCFSERVCCMCLMSECGGGGDLGLCAALALAFGEPQRNGKI